MQKDTKNNHFFDETRFPTLEGGKTRLAWLKISLFRELCVQVTEQFWSTFAFLSLSVRPLRYQSSNFFDEPRDKRRKKITCLMGGKKRACKNASSLLHPRIPLRDQESESDAASSFVRSLSEERVRAHLTYTHVSLCGAGYTAHIKCQCHFYTHKSRESEWERET